MRIKPVKQKHKYACSIACASMVTGEDYDEIIKKFGNNFHKNGVDDEVLYSYFGDLGYSILLKDLCRYNEVNFARSEMFRPFAPIHLVRIKLNPDSGLLHWVVMSKKGKLICPMEWSDAQIRNCWSVLKVIGLYK